MIMRKVSLSCQKIDIVKVIKLNHRNQILLCMSSMFMQDSLASSIA